MAKGLITTGVAIVALALCGLGLYGTAASTKHTGITMEQGLSADYQDDQLELDAGVKKITETMSILNVGFANQASVLRAALSGQLSASIDPASGKSPFMMVLQQNMPKVDTSVYNRIIDQDLAFRENFKQKQIIFRDKIRAFQTWENDGIIAPIFIRLMGFPDQNLEARIGSETWHGQEALDHMKVLVTSVDTDTSFQTGHEAPIVMPGTPTTPTKSN